MVAKARIVDTRNQVPPVEMDDYLQATRNFFVLAKLDCCLLELAAIGAKIDRLGGLLDLFGPDWRLAHAAAVDGKLVVAVVKQHEQGLLFDGECFPHFEFHQHVERVGKYMAASADMNEHPNSTDHQLQYEAAKRLAFPTGPGSKVESVLKSLTRAEPSTVTIVTGDNRITSVKLPARGALLRDKTADEESSKSKSRLSIARIVNATVAWLADGSMAVLPLLSADAIAEAALLEHSPDCPPSRMTVREGEGLRVLSSNQMPLPLLR